MVAAPVCRSSTVSHSRLRMARLAAINLRALGCGAALLLPQLAWCAVPTCSISNMQDIDFGVVTVPANTSVGTIIGERRASYSYSCDSNSNSGSELTWAGFSNEFFPVLKDRSVSGTFPLDTGIPGIGFQLIATGGNIFDVADHWGVTPATADIDIPESGRYSQRHNARYRLVVTGKVKSGSLVRQAWSLSYANPGVLKVYHTHRGPTLRINVVAEPVRVPTCNIDSAAASQSIHIGTFTSTVFRGIHSVSTPKPFSITLTQCNGATVWVTATPSTAVISATQATFAPASGGGTQGLAFQLLDSAGRLPFTLGKQTAVGTGGSKTTPGSLTLGWQARVYQTGAAVAGGKMNSKLVMTFAYQ